jgi:hypothetical protein
MHTWVHAFGFSEGHGLLPLGIRSWLVLVCSAKYLFTRPPPSPALVQRPPGATTTPWSTAPGQQALCPMLLVKPHLIQQPLFFWDLIQGPLVKRRFCNAPAFPLARSMPLLDQHEVFFLQLLQPWNLMDPFSGCP